MSDRRAPSGLGAAGKRLWDAVTQEFDLAEQELALLEQAARTRDVIATLDGVVKRDGPLSASSQGVRIHPAIAEARQQRLALARLLATLDVPALEEDVDQLPSARRARGVYDLRGAR